MGTLAKNGLKQSYKISNDGEVVTISLSISKPFPAYKLKWKKPFIISW